MKLTILKDINGNDYLGFDISKSYASKRIVEMYIDNMNLEIIGFDKCNKKLLERNKNSYHITIFNVKECGINKDLLLLKNLQIDDIKFNGVGSINNGDNITYFIIVESKHIKTIRSLSNMDERDLHITIGFNNKDLFHDRKNIANILK